MRRIHPDRGDPKGPGWFWYSQRAPARWNDFWKRRIYNGSLRFPEYEFREWYFWLLGYEITVGHISQRGCDLADRDWKRQQEEGLI